MPVSCTLMIEKLTCISTKSHQVPMWSTTPDSHFWTGYFQQKQTLTKYQEQTDHQYQDIGRESTPQKKNHSQKMTIQYQDTPL